MTSPDHRIRRLIQLSLVFAAGIGFVISTGCSGDSEEEEVAVERAPAPPPPPPAPRVTPIADLMAEMSIDDRIIFPEDAAPDNDGDRRAILTFFDAFARGDVEALGSMMSLYDRIQLDELAGAPEWTAAVEDISAIELQTGEVIGAGQPCVLAIFEVGYDFQPQLWYYSGSGDQHSFEAAPTPPDMMNQLSGDNWIRAWHDIVQSEIEMANALEEELEPEQQILANSDGGGGTAPNRAQPGDGQPGSPGPGAPPGRRRNNQPPRRAPGPGGN